MECIEISLNQIVSATLFFFLAAAVSVVWAMFDRLDNVHQKTVIGMVLGLILCFIFLWLCLDVF